jgi:predicted O-methyltransferase YrrM
MRPGLRRLWRWLGLLLILLQGERVVGVVRGVSGDLWITENPFCRFVRSGPFVIQTAMNKRRPWLPCASHYRSVAGVLKRTPVKRFLMIGLGGGGFLHAVRRHHPGAAITALDVDPVMPDLARQYFSAPPEAELLLLDPRDYLGEGNGLFDFVFIDAFDGMYPPEELLSGWFFESVAGALSPGGVVCMNTVRRHPWDARHGKIKESLEKAFVLTSEECGTAGKVMPLLPHNVIICGTRREGGEVKENDRLH